MVRVIISESEKKEILKKHGVLLESTHTFEELPGNIQNAVKELYKCVNREESKINDDISKEFEQEKGTRNDNGGVDQKAKSQVDKLLSAIKRKFPNVDAKIVSSYRSYSKQVQNFCSKVKAGRTFEDVQKANTIPGFSQHHTGKAFDIISTKESYWEKSPKLTKWVADNCGKFGFEVTYKENGVLREKEPWHLYYIGGETETEQDKKQENKVDPKNNQTKDKTELKKELPTEYPFNDNENGWQL